MDRQRVYFAEADGEHFRWQTGPGYFADTERALLALAHLPARGRLLEIGCGEGGNLHHLGPRPGRVGVDFSHAKLRHAAAHVAGAAFARADAARLPFPDGAFDAVLIRDLLHHVPDRAAALREAVRVLPGGGALAAIEPNRAGPLSLAQALFVRAERAVLRSHASRLEAELRDAGLGDVSLRRAQPFPLARALLHPRLGLSGWGSRAGVARALGAAEALAEKVVPRPMWMVLVARGRKQ